MSDEKNSLKNKIFDVSMAAIVMDRSGPWRTINASDLSDDALALLGIRVLTALLAGTSRMTNRVGPGKIRGLLEIGETKKFAIAFDVEVEDVDKAGNKLHEPYVIIFIFLDETIVKKHRLNLEVFEKILLEQLENKTNVDDYTITLLNKLKLVIQNKINEELAKEKGHVDGKFDITNIMELPESERKMLRTLFHLSKEKDMFTLKEISSIAEKSTNETLNILIELMKKGYVYLVSKRKKTFYTLNT